MKRTIVYTMAFSLFFTVFTSCNQSNNTSSSGTQGYAFKEGGQAEIRITKENDSYFVSVGKNEKWERPERLDNVSDKDFIDLFGQNWKSYVKAGLHKDIFGIFKVEKGYTYSNHTFKTGYFVMFIGGGDVYKL